MGRPKRADAAGHCNHMLNRANRRELEKIHWSVKRGVPFGDETWVEHIVKIRLRVHDATSRSPEEANKMTLKVPDTFYLSDGFIT